MQANDVLQQDLAGRPGTVAAALAIEKRLPAPSHARRTATEGGAGNESGAIAVGSRWSHSLLEI